MPVLYRLRVTSLPLLIAVLQTACEPDSARYDRLHRDLLEAEIPVRLEAEAQAANRPQCPELTKLPTDAYLNECTRKIEADEARLALAQREMNRFMNR